MWPYIVKKCRSIFSSSVIFLLIPIVSLMICGLLTISNFTTDDLFALKQAVSIVVSLAVLLIASRFNYRALRESRFVLLSYSAMILVLTLLFILGHVAKGAQSWFHFGTFSFQPVDVAKLVIIVLLAKYFSKRHVEIARYRHIAVSFLYCLIPAGLILMQPDLGGALVIMGIWVVMILVSGVKIKHFAILIIALSVLSTLAWKYSFAPYQKDRILNVFDPMRDPQGSGYNVIQSLIAVGSGGVYGKGVGYGTQSRMMYLPEYKTDFIFAAFVEEWGAVGGIFVILAFLLILYKLSTFATVAESNFEALFTYGVMGWILVHVIENIGMNLGLAPVTGIPLPFMSYGGSHMVAECLAIGMCLGMYRSSLASHRSSLRNDFFGDM